AAGSGALSHSPDVAHTSVDPSGRHALVDLSSPSTPPRILAGPAAVIWECVDGSRDRAAVVAAVADEVGLSPDEVRDDVEGFVGELLGLGLLREGPA
ncbi:PqqD family peptide modification chaperone, partial [Nocardioides yefusunii]